MCLCMCLCELLFIVGCVDIEEDDEEDDDLVVDIDIVEEKIREEKEKMSGRNAVDAFTLSHFLEKVSPSSRNTRTPFNATYSLFTTLPSGNGAIKGKGVGRRSNALSQLVVEKEKKRMELLSSNTQAYTYNPSTAFPFNADDLNAEDDGANGGTEGHTDHFGNNDGIDDDDVFDFGGDNDFGDQWEDANGTDIAVNNQQNLNSIGNDDIFAAQTTPYEELVRQHVAQFVSASHKLIHESDLTKRVRVWEEKIAPVLAEEAMHRPFDIHKYGEELVNTMSKEQKNPVNGVVLVNDVHICLFLSFVIACFPSVLSQ
eukprot:m.92184 g.92184  ORF g.92184 m.92184 type:complete len:314 (+) comp12351_c0_seq4:1-942(+)